MLMKESDLEDSQLLSPGEQSAGDQPSLTVEQAIANLRGSDLGLRYYAAWWLGRFRVTSPEAIDALVDSLADEADFTTEGGYPLRRNAARALGKLGDCRAVPGLNQCLTCEDFYVREAAIQSLGMLGDRDCIPTLTSFLEPSSEVTQPESAQLESTGIQLKQPYNAILEALGMLGATEAIPLIEPFLSHPLEAVQYSAARAMFELTQESAYADCLIQALLGEKLPLRRAALADLGAIGYFPAAEAISNTLAENSLKLIALKGILEKQVQQDALPILSESSLKVMALMDELL